MTLLSSAEQVVTLFLCAVQDCVDKSGAVASEHLPIHASFVASHIQSADNKANTLVVAAAV